MYTRDSNNNKVVYKSKHNVVENWDGEFPEFSGSNIAVYILAGVILLLVIILIILLIKKRS
jgi:hypothetical protein